MHDESSNFIKTINRLGELYRTNPEQYELERKRLIEQTISDFPEAFRERAYGMQFHLDAKLSLTKDPVSRFNLMIELFWNQVHDFSHALVDPADCLARKKRNWTRGKLIPLKQVKGADFNN